MACKRMETKVLFFVTIKILLHFYILLQYIRACGKLFLSQLFSVVATAFELKFVLKLHQVSRFLGCVVLILGFMGQGNADSQCDELSFRKRRWSSCKGGVLVYPEPLASGPVCWCTPTRGRTWSWSMSTPSWEPLKPINSALWTLHLLISMWPILQMQALVFILMKR